MAATTLSVPKGRPQRSRGPQRTSILEIRSSRPSQCRAAQIQDDAIGWSPLREKDVGGNSLQRLYTRDHRSDARGHPHQ